MADYAAYARKYGDLMANYEKHWKGKIGLSEFGKMHYEGHGKKEGRQLGGGSSSSSSSDKKESSKIYDKDGKAYSPSVSGKIFGSNPNKSYEGSGEISGGRIGGNSVDDRSKVSIYMTKRGSRGIQGPSGEIFYETSPNSLTFRSVAGGDSGGFININDLGSKKAEEEAAKSEPSGEEGGGGSSGGGSSSGSFIQGGDNDAIDSALDEYLASLDGSFSGETDYDYGSAAELADADPAEDLDVASGSGISGTVLTSGVVEETTESVLTPVSTEATEPYAGSSTLTEGTQVVDTVNGKVYPNKAAALADGVKAYMPKSQWDALTEAE